ncbi:MAG: O-antigen ligase family protein [Limisphaerales bacterium]
MKRGFPWIPVVYFVLLLPAVVQSLYKVPPKLAKDFISFYLSGPFCMAVCALFFSQLELDSARLQRLISWLVFPVASIAAAALFGLGTSESIEFGTNSNFAASGGFGPNQVSAILGLGALYLVLMALSLRLGRGLRLATVLMAVWFCAQAALSFSRSGIYLLGASLLAATPFLSLRRLLHPLTVAAACLAIIAGVGAWTYLERFTGGKLGERFAALDLTGRDRIARQDLDLWQRNILFGAGIGMSGLERDESAGGRIAAHTEYTRLLAEHGLLGIFALLLLLAAAALNVLRRRPSYAKPVMIAGTAWAMLYLAVSGMRTAAPAFLIGLGLARATALPILTAKMRRLAIPGLRSPILPGPGPVPTPPSVGPVASNP